MTYRIAFLTGSLYEGASGVRVVVESLSRELVRLGHEVCVFGGVQPASKSEFPESWNGADSRGFAIQGPASFGYSSKMYSDIAAFKPDIVHVHGIWQYTSVVGLKLKEKTGATLVVSPHGSLAKAALTQSGIRKKLAFLTYQNACFKAADGFHVTCQSEVEELCGFTASPNILTVRNGVDRPAATVPAYDTRDDKILALCRMEPKKGLEELLAAWALFNVTRPSWSLEIQGPSRRLYRSQLENIVREHGLTNVYFRDAVYGAQRDVAIASSKIFALPSRNENFGMTVAEALSLGTPVIASTGSPWKELHSNDCGWWVDSEPTALAETLFRATETPTERLRAMGERGQIWMDNEFRWSQIAQEFSDFYTTLRRTNSTGVGPKDKSE